MPRLIEDKGGTCGELTAVALLLTALAILTHPRELRRMWRDLRP